jgi:hypothetical protein
MKRNSAQPRGRPVTGHIKVQFNIKPEVSRLIDKGAARNKTTRSQYVELLVQADQAVRSRKKEPSKPS